MEGKRTKMGYKKSTLVDTSRIGEEPDDSNGSQAGGGPWARKEGKEE